VTNRPSYIERKLTEGERVVYQAGLHWILLLTPFLLILLGGVSAPEKGETAWFLMGAGIILEICAGISYKNSAIALTNRRLLGKMGFPWKKRNP